MAPTQCDVVSHALASAGVCTWSWQVDSPDELRLVCARDILPCEPVSKMSDEDWQQLQAQLRVALHDGCVFEATVSLSSDDGSSSDVVFRGGRVMDAGGNAGQVSGVCWPAVDVGQRNEQAQWAPLAKLSHELRSPITAIAHLTADMQAQSPPPALNAAISEIDQNARFMLRLIGDMLDAFRAGEPKAGHNPEIVATRPLVDQLAPLAGERASLKGITFEVCRRDGFPEHFWAEPVALRRILQNLIDNAIKFTETGGVSLAMGVGGDDDEPQLYFDVIDTGPGISKVELERVFAPFAQGRSGQRSVEGLGLGLSLSRQLARVLGGGLEIDSEPGRGSRFRLSIAFTAVSAEELSTLRAEQVDETSAESETKRVLLVEDHPLLSKYTGRELAALGCSVDIAANAHDAIAAVEQHERDVVILDLDLPDMSGYDLCRLLVDRDIAGKCRYVAYSGSDDIADREAAEAAGFDAFFVKPTSARELLGL